MVKENSITYDWNFFIEIVWLFLKKFFFLRFFVERIICMSLWKYIVSFNNLVLLLSCFLFSHFSLYLNILLDSFFTYIYVYYILHNWQPWRCAYFIRKHSLVSACSHIHFVYPLIVTTTARTSWLQTENRLLITFHTWCMLNCLFNGKSEFFSALNW